MISETERIRLLEEKCDRLERFARDLLDRLKVQDFDRYHSLEKFLDEEDW